MIFFFLDPQILLRDGEADQFALIHDLHILERVAAKLREGRRGLRAVALLTDNELAFMNRNGFILEEMTQRQRAQPGTDTVPSYFSYASVSSTARSI